MTWCDLEGPECYREIIRKARKPHVCGDCKSTILPKERYTYISGIWEAEPASYHRCQDCTHLRCEIQRETGGDHCMPINGLAAWIEDAAPYTKGDGTHPFFKWAAMFNAYAGARGSKRRIDVKFYDKETECPSSAPSV